MHLPLSGVNVLPHTAHIAVRAAASCLLCSALLLELNLFLQVGLQNLLRFWFLNFTN
jgi:hypothetical protein